jgi:hypothetical protein
MKREHKELVIHTCSDCKALSSLPPDGLKACLACGGANIAEVGGELPF